jgi:hypothetical protein
MSDAEIVRRHDERTEYFDTDIAVRAVYAGELDRRAAERSARAANRLAVITTVVSVLALIVAVVALIKT